MSITKKSHVSTSTQLLHVHNVMYVGSFHIKLPNALHSSHPDFDETAYIWSL